MAKKRKVLAISQRHLKIKYPDGKIVWRSALGDRYVKYWDKMGADLYPIPNTVKNLSEYLNKIKPDGIIISGGMGVPATLWGEKITFPNTFSDDRVRIDKELIKYSIKNNVPLLGICTGLHYINVYFDGKLLQNIPAEVGGPIEHVGNNHQLIIDGNEIKVWLGEKIQTNSYHGQGITKEGLSKDLIPFALCKKDGTIEAAYHPKFQIAGITWHPERDSPDDEVNRKLVEAFLNKEFFWKAK